MATGLQVIQEALSVMNSGESMRDKVKQAGQRLIQRAIKHLHQEKKVVLDDFANEQRPLVSPLKRE